MKKINKRFLLASVGSLAMITAVTAVAASCKKENSDDTKIDWKVLNRNTIISYKNNHETKFEDVPTTLTKDLFICKNTLVGVTVEFISAKKTTDRITIDYKLTKNNESSEIFTKELDIEHFLHDHAAHENHHDHDHGHDDHDHDHDEHGTVDFEALKKTVTINYVDASKVSFADAKTTNEVYTLTSTDKGATVIFVSASKEADKLVVSYKLTKNNQTSTVFTFDIPSTVFANGNGNENPNPNPQASSAELKLTSFKGDANAKLENKFLAQTTISYTDAKHGLVYLGKNYSEEDEYGLHLSITRRSGAMARVFIQEVNEANELVGELIGSEAKEIERSTLMAKFKTPIDKSKKYSLVKVELYNEVGSNPFETILTNGMKPFSLSINSTDSNNTDTNVYLDEQNSHVLSLGDNQYELKLRVDNPMILKNKSFKVVATPNANLIGSPRENEDDVYAERASYDDGFLKVVFTTRNGGLAFNSAPERYYIKMIQVESGWGDESSSKPTLAKIDTINGTPFYSPVSLKDKQAKTQYELEYTKSDYQWFDYERLPALPLNKMGDIFTNNLDGHYGTKYTILTILPLYSGNTSNEDLQQTGKTHSFNIWLHFLDSNGKKLTKVKPGTFVVFEVEEYDLSGHKTDKALIKSEPNEVDFAGRLYLEFRGKRSYDAVDTKYITANMFYKLKAVRFYSDPQMQHEIEGVQFKAPIGTIFTTLNTSKDVQEYDGIDFGEGTGGSSGTSNPEKPVNPISGDVTPETLLGSSYKQATYKFNEDKTSVTITFTNPNISKEMILKAFANDDYELDDITFPIKFVFSGKYLNADGNFAKTFDSEGAIINSATDSFSVTFNVENPNENFEFLLEGILIQSSMDEDLAEWTNIDINSKLRLTPAA
ncbi:hypothetical protein OF376_00260 [Ureaplasma miroungigenitalium]|uniref:Uncharacterized protein n=1 Tax=Ureaplasma miroungigenitalium TaxID=1042321 RepID=A0ABT3BLU6_9BACT|nr:hypothetical protein [Ureaplasma miroungigenitalium]MCV3728223.1 hypothetical protein [Ureaplasma miroungigenitalium]